MKAAFTLKPGQKVLVLGPFQVGKSEGAYRLVADLPAVLAWDPMGEWADRPGAIVCNVEGIEAAIRKAKGRGLVAVVDEPERLNDFCAVACRLPGWVVIIDELGLSLVSASASAVPPKLGKLWRTGHKDGITLILITHRMAEVPVILRNVHHLMHYKTLQHNDMEALEAIIGEEKMADFKRLKKFHFMHRASAGRVTFCPPMAKPKPTPTQK